MSANKDKSAAKTPKKKLDFSSSKKVSKNKKSLIEQIILDSASS